MVLQWGSGYRNGLVSVAMYSNNKVSRQLKKHLSDGFTGFMQLPLNNQRNFRSHHTKIDLIRKQLLITSENFRLQAIGKSIYTFRNC